MMKTINERGKRLMDGFKEIFKKNDIVHCINGYPAMFSYAIGREKVTCQRDWATQRRIYYLHIIELLIERGVMPDHDAREPWFLCYSHSDKDIDETLDRFMPRCGERGKKVIKG